MTEKKVGLDDFVQQVMGQLGTEVDGEVVLMNITTGKYYGLDSVGSDVWTRLEKPIVVRALCKELSEIYDASVPEIERDVLDLLDSLKKSELVSVLVPSD